MQRVAAEGQQHVDHLLRVVVGRQQAFHSPSGVSRLVWMCSGLRSGWAKGADRLAASVRLLVVDLEQQRLVRLDLGSVIHRGPCGGLSAASTLLLDRLGVG